MEPDANAGDLAEQFGVTQSAVSHRSGLAGISAAIGLRLRSLRYRVS